MPVTGRWVRSGSTIVVHDADGDAPEQFLGGVLTPLPPPPARTLQPTAEANARAFQRRYPKIDPSPDSMRGLTETYRRTLSGGRLFTPRPGEYLSVHTRAAAAELKTLVAYAANPGVERIEILPSRSGQRTPDFVVHIRGGGKTRFEVTTLTGAGSGYQPTGDPGKITEVEAIVQAVRRKVLGRSQLSVSLEGVPPGGTLVVHLPRGGSGADDKAKAAGDKVQAAMERLADDLLKAPYVYGIQFVLPGSGAVLYIRTTHGTYQRA